jgi:hypothetical protein
MYDGRNIFVCSLMGIESMLTSFSSLNDHETNESIGAAYHLLPVLLTTPFTRMWLKEQAISMIYCRERSNGGLMGWIFEGRG